MTERHWRTEVYNRGEHILTIEHACLSGKESLTDDDKEVIRIAGENLLGFVGKREDDDEPISQRFAIMTGAVHPHRDAVSCYDWQGTFGALRWRIGESRLNIVQGETEVLVSVTAKRGDVFRFLSALGIELKETPITPMMA